MDYIKKLYASLGIKLRDADSIPSVNEQRIAESLFPWRSKEVSVNK